MFVVVVAVLAACSDDEVGAPPATTQSVEEATDTEEAGEQLANDQTGDPAAGGFGRDELGGFVNPCAVLTEDEVAAATGLTVTGSEDQGPVGCAWFVDEVDPEILADDAISWQPFPPEQFVAQQQAIDQGLDGEEISGLGNAAVYIGTETSVRSGYHSMS